MRRELKVPLQFSGVRIERQHAIGIQIVAGTNAAVEVRARVAGGPVQRVGFRVVRARHPRGAAAVQVQIPGPAFGAGFSRSRNSPETPRQFSRGRVIRRHKATHAVVSARGTNDHLVVHHQGRAGGAVVLVPVRVRYVPQQVSRTSVQAKQMGVVGQPVHPRVPQRDAAAEVPGRIVDQSLRDRPRVMPDHQPSARIQRVGIVGRGHEHDAVRDYGRDLQPVRIAGMEYPLRPQLSDICRIDLRQAAEAAATEVSVVGEPIRSGWRGDQLSGKHVNHHRPGCFRRLVRSRNGQATQQCRERQCRLSAHLLWLSPPHLAALKNRVYSLASKRDLGHAVYKQGN